MRSNHYGSPYNLFVVIIAAIAMSACFSDYAGDAGTITVSFGSGGARLAVTPQEQASMVHTIIITGPGPTQTAILTGSTGSITFTGVPGGEWTVTVWGRNYASPDMPGLPEYIVRAWGQETVTLPAVNPIVTVSMFPAAEVENFLQLETAINNVRPDGEEIIIVKNSFAITDRIQIEVGNISLVTDTNRSLSRGSGFTEEFFFVNSESSTLRLGRTGFNGTLTINGAGTANRPLIRVGQGTLILNNHAVLTGNNNNNDADRNVRGGAVNVGNDSGDFAEFIMNGGSIRNNNAASGGGVHFHSANYFTMNGGEIRNNTASQWGGGVLLWDGTFVMNGGTISGNNADEGGGVSNRLGTFTMNGGTITGNTATYNAGGVYIFGGAGAIFNRNGGTVTGNTPNNVVNDLP